MEISFSGYDEPLGPRTGRYFGDGYQKVGHDFGDVAISRSNQPGAKHSAVASLAYPSSWSTKSSRELVPHVSSIDTVVLATTLCDAAVTHARDLTAAESEAAGLTHALREGRPLWIPRQALPDGHIAQDDGAQGVAATTKPENTTPDVASLENELDSHIATNHAARLSL